MAKEVLQLIYPPGIPFRRMAVSLVNRMLLIRPKYLGQNPRRSRTLYREAHETDSKAFVSKIKDLKPHIALYIPMEGVPAFLMCGTMCCVGHSFRFSIDTMKLCNNCGGVHPSGFFSPAHLCYFFAVLLPFSSPLAPPTPFVPLELPHLLFW